MTRAVFLVLPGVEILDFAGPLQALWEARQLGADYEIRTCSPFPEAPSAQGPALARLEPLVEPREGDLVFVPGSPEFRRGLPEPRILEWIWKADRAGCRFLSICTGAFLLADAGLLDGRECTTHWACLEALKARRPGAKVLENRLFVASGNVTTSAGIVAGVDMTLDLLAQRHGPLLAAKVARTLVVHLRRDGAHDQGSVYLDHRGHLNQAVHALQDRLASRPGEDHPLAELAREAGMSVRSLTRQFRASTGLSIRDFLSRARLERARDLLRDPGLTLDAIAAQCGLGEARSLRRLWRQTFQEPLSAARRPPEPAP